MNCICVPSDNYPYWRDEGMAPDAMWIWTSEAVDDNEVWCRYVVSGRTQNSAPWCHDLHDWQHNIGHSKCMLDGTLQADTKMEFYYNNMLMVGCAHARLACRPRRRAVCRSCSRT